MNFCVCDSSQVYQELLIKILEMYCSRKYLTCSFDRYSDGACLVDDFCEHYISPDVVFIEMELKPINGYETCIKLRKSGYCGELAIISAHKDLAIYGYEIEARAFLLKPYNPLQIFNSLTRIVEKTFISAITISEHGKITKIPLSEIMYIESFHQKCCIHCSKGLSYSVCRKLNDLEAEIGSEKFLRCHRSFLVNLDFIRAADLDFELINGEIVPIRQKERRKIKNIYKNYLPGMERRLMNRPLQNIEGVCL